MDTTNRQLELNRLHDQAHYLAPKLRAEAIDAFWHGAGRALHAALSGARHAAQRLMQRMHPHDTQPTPPLART